MLSYEHTVIICTALALTAMGFSTVTVITQNWRWYLPTVLLAVAAFALSIWGMIVF